tara:strand:+ start:1622 stop:2224 length:603 start_codon:yes stop_codon:yes gene_type:complete
VNQLEQKNSAALEELKKALASGQSTVIAKSVDTLRQESAVISGQLNETPAQKLKAMVLSDLEETPEEFGVHNDGLGFWPVSSGKNMPAHIVAQQEAQFRQRQFQRLLQKRHALHERHERFEDKVLGELGWEFALHHHPHDMAHEMEVEHGVDTPDYCPNELAHDLETKTLRPVVSEDCSSHRGHGHEKPKNVMQFIKGLV